MKGIIPAYAGSTVGDNVAYLVTGDHPRIRGEHAEASHAYNHGLGSSPHTRGAPVTTQISLKWLRIIPAYAGSTDSIYKAHWLMTDHPRIRGEHFC